MPSEQASEQRLAPWWVRLLVYVALVLIALVAITVIDSHVMQQAAQP